MQRHLTIGIDVGTTSTKAGAFTAEGQELATGHCATRLIRAAGGVEQDPVELEQSVYRAVGECLARGGISAGDVAAIALTGQMAGVMGIDGRGDAVTPYDSWLDARAAAELDHLASRHADLLVRVTGCPPMMNHAPKMAWWRTQRPADYDRIAAFVMPSVYVAMRMAGLGADAAFTDPSYLHFTGAADGASGSWSHQAMDALGVDPARMPRIVPPSTVVGEVTAAAAQACGLVAGTPIVAGLGDTAAGAVGAGIVRSGQLLDTAGTAGVLLGSVDGFCCADDLMVMRGALPGQYLPLNYVAGAGLCLPWLAETTLADAPDALDLLTGEAAEIAPGCDGLTFVPHVEGRIVPRAPGMRGAWLGFTLQHTRGHLARAMMEAIAFEYAGYLESIRRAVPTVAFDEVRAIGGGARNPVWNQIKADVLGVPVRRVRAEETATRGAALVAAWGVGALDDLPAVAAQVPLDAPVEPNPDRHAAYARLTVRYLSLVETVSHLPAADLPTLHLEAVS